MSEGDDGNLHGWQLVILLVFFNLVAGLLYLASWLTRPNFLYDGPMLCAAIAGGLCYPARWLVERADWWKRLEIRRVERAANAHPVRDRVLRGLRIVVGLPIAVGSLAILPVGISSARDDQRLVAAGPVQSAEVVSVAVEEDRWSTYDDMIVKVARPGDGVPVELSGGDELDPLPRVGDRVNVVVDPSDPSYVLAAGVDWRTPWWAYLLGVVLTLLMLGLGLTIAFG
ncbi:hypothetical protein GCM10029976_037610 [Kribbella albertanoniae]|uniref:DUF3592 domain-containing protein n=1 Tax=Kribbella albertanoniae TaxID=1266829 RepID=A0A4R4Q9J0_9ACTN|nr:DUF3592 domain-containing protein [Kribbella albertanoniae]TDC31900.1 hypothetical protein E1261_09705 [Kribbella albertanoniae]